MGIHSTVHPRWGNNLANQVKADDMRKFGDDGEGYQIVTVSGLFGGMKQKRKYVGSLTCPATDENFTRREFHHRCGICRITLLSHCRKGQEQFLVLLDGHSTSRFWLNEIEFRFASDELKDNDGNPVAEIWFYGNGKRWGPLEMSGSTRIICTFSSKEQMEEYLDNSTCGISSIHEDGDGGGDVDCDADGD